MIEKYGLFDSLEGDERVYAEADFALLIRALGRDGVYGEENALKIMPTASGLGVNVKAGSAIIQGRYYALEDDGSGEKTISLTTASANPRIDRIVLCLNYNMRTVSIGVLNGTEAASPTVPALMRSTAQYMISLAQIHIGVGAASLDEGDIVDERADETLCGLHTVSAQTAMGNAQEAKRKAELADAAAGEAKETATQALTRADMGVSDAAEALAEAKKRIPAVTDASAGNLPEMDAAGNLVDSGVSLSDFTQAKMTLSGTTLMITTI